VGPVALLSVRRYVFFFSSRRRHTRFSRDWSSDVCSSDLKPSESKKSVQETTSPIIKRNAYTDKVFILFNILCFLFSVAFFQLLRSEERRVGKECSSRWSPTP